MNYLINEIDNSPVNQDPVTSEEIKIDIIIHNITISFEAGCEVDFKKIPEKYITTFPRSQFVTFKIDNCTIITRNSGKLLSMGASSVDQTVSAAKKSIEILRSWGFEATFNDYKVVNIFCSCLMPWRIQIIPMVTKYRDLFTYEPEIHNYCTLNTEKQQGYIAIYTSGYIRIIGHNIEMVLDATEKVLPFLAEFRV